MPTHFLLSASQRDVLVAYLADRESVVTKELSAMMVGLPGVVADATKGEPPPKATKGGRKR